MRPEPYRRAAAGSNLNSSPQCRSAGVKRGYRPFRAARSAGPVGLVLQCRVQSARARIYVGMASLTEFSLAEAIAVLTRTPATLNALLRGLPNIWVRCNEGKDTWNAFDIVGHLIFGERADWMPRVRIILENGEARAFDPFDRFAQLKETQDKSLEQLLEDFAHLRRENLAALQALNLQLEDLTRRGRHPALGVVTLSELLATWAVHDLTHLHQLSEVVALVRMAERLRRQARECTESELRQFDDCYSFRYFMLRKSASASCHGRSGGSFVFSRIARAGRFALRGNRVDGTGSTVILFPAMR